MEKAKEKLRQELQEDVESVEEAQRPEELARSYEARKREEAEIKARFWRDVVDEIRQANEKRISNINHIITVGKHRKV